MLCARAIVSWHAPRNTCFVADGSLLLGDGGVAGGDGGVAGGDGGAEPAGSGKGLMAVIGVPANWVKAARATATAWSAWMRWVSAAASSALAREASAPGRSSAFTKADTWSRIIDS